MYNLSIFLETLHMMPLRLRNITRLIGWDDGQPPGGTVEARHAMFLWLADFLQTFDTHTNHDQVESMLMAFRKQILEYGKQLQEALDSKSAELPVRLLTVSDRRYVTITDATEFLDLNTGNRVEAILRDSAYMGCFNLCSIYTRQVERYQRLTKKHVPPA
jgi:hypothetical protein